MQEETEKSSDSIIQNIFEIVRESAIAITDNPELKNIWHVKKAGPDTWDIEGMALCNHRIEGRHGTTSIQADGLHVEFMVTASGATPVIFHEGSKTDLQTRAGIVSDLAHQISG